MSRRHHRPLRHEGIMLKHQSKLSQPIIFRNILFSVLGQCVLFIYIYVCVSADRVFLLPPHCIYKINCFYRKALEKQFHNEIGRLPKIVLYHIFINGTQALARYIFFLLSPARFKL